MCNNWPKFPKAVSAATGGLIENTVMICGGNEASDECYSLSSGKRALVTHLSVGRIEAASIVINDNTLWVTGGVGGSAYLSSTEYVTITGTILGPDMPMACSLHTMVAINSTCSMVIGGYGASALSFFFDHNEGEWTTGPSLIQARFRHAAGIVTDEVTDEQFVAVTGGVYDGDLDSTGILQDGKWVQGKMTNTICIWKPSDPKILL